MTRESRLASRLPTITSATNRTTKAQGSSEVRAQVADRLRALEDLARYWADGRLGDVDLFDAIQGHLGRSRFLLEVAA